MLSTKQNKQGVIQVSLAILLWGILPLYWKLLESVPAQQILANRIIWSCVFVLLIVSFRGQFKQLLHVFKYGNCKTLILCGFIISLNWFTYIYAVNTGHIVDASLGYYINPLLTIFLGRVVLKEKLNIFQSIAVALAAIGVAVITFSHGRLPLITLVLACTFAVYSLLKKKVTEEVTLGLTVETLAVLPVAAGYLFYLSLQAVPVYSGLSAGQLLLLMSTGVITVIPLMLFSQGAKTVPLTTIGFIQYLAPTISLLLGIFLYHEPFTGTYLITFIFIWVALLIYSLSQIIQYSAYKRYKSV